MKPEDWAQGMVNEAASVEDAVWAGETLGVHIAAERRRNILSVIGATVGLQVCLYGSLLISEWPSIEAAAHINQIGVLKLLSYGWVSFSAYDGVSSSSLSLGTFLTVFMTLVFALGLSLGRLRLSSQWIAFSGALLLPLAHFAFGLLVGAGATTIASAPVWLTPLTMILMGSGTWLAYGGSRSTRGVRV